MIKVIIISYFFPPSNFVGGERTEAWAKYLHESGIYPIIITRKWNDNQKTITEKVINNSYEIESNEQFEIRRLPYKRTLRDRCTDYTFLKPIQKALTLWELVVSNYSVNALAYANFYTEARKILKEDNDIIGVIASGRPFQSFAIGHKLKKEFPRKLWLPDYRDEWTTHNYLLEASTLTKFINKLERKSELKWTSNADQFISVSKPWVDTISKLIKKDGEVVFNGYKKYIENPKRSISKSSLIITYAGSLYHNQNIEIFVNTVKRLIDQKESIFIRFIGIDFQKDAFNRISELLIDYTEHYEIIDRLPRTELEPFINSSDLLFLTSFENIKGWFPVKLFEYYASGIPLLLCPTDHESMEDFIVKTNSGFIADSLSECEFVLKKCIVEKRREGFIKTNRNTKEGIKYSRQYQTKQLADIILAQNN